jgi:hypothetical protein
VTGLNIEVSSKALKPEGDTLEGMMGMFVLVGENVLRREMMLMRGRRLEEMVHTVP